MHSMQAALPMILSLDKGGRPVEWLHWKKAVGYMVTGQVIWGFGDSVMSVNGGHNCSGERTVVELPPIMSIKGADASHVERESIALTNKALFERDNHQCLYCGEQFPESVLTRDHVYPRGKGGLDTWDNVVCACWQCNNLKGCRSADEAGMPLLALPYTPSHIEGLLLSNRRIVTEQSTFLEKQLPRRSPLLAA